MKRCPQCHRVETDEALGFCRADGTPLVSDSGSVSADTGTVRFGSSPVASEVDTSVLPRALTDANMSRPTAPTTVLDRQQTISRTRELSRPHRSKAIVAICAIIAAALAASLYFYLSQKNSAAINSIAVLPFQNASGDPNMEYLSDGIAESLMNIGQRLFA